MVFLLTKTSVINNIGLLDQFEAGVILQYLQFYLGMLVTIIEDTC